MNRFNRRQFLKLGSSALALPLLESIPGSAFAATASGSVNRVFFYVLSNGWYEDQIFPKSTAYQTGAEGVRYIPLSSISGSMSQFFTDAKWSSFKSRMNLMRGFDILAPGSPQGGHDMKIALCAGSDGSSVSGSNTSIDNLIANAAGFYPSTPHRKSINVAPPGNHNSSKYNYSFQNGSNKAQIGGPAALFSDLFSTGVPSGTGGGGTVTTTTMASASDPYLSRRIAINHAISRINSLATNGRFSSADKLKLTEYGSFLNSILPTIVAPTTSSGTTTSGSSTGSIGSSCAVPPSPSGINEDANATGTSVEARIQSCLYQIYMAFNCQLTNVAVMHPVVAHTDCWHMGDTGNDNYHQLVGHTRHLTNYYKYKGWVFDQLLYFLKLMDSTKDSNGLTMLDNSLVVVISNDACSIHSCQDIPVITIGGLGGKIKTGNFINYQRTDAPQMTGEMEINQSSSEAGSYYHRYTYNLGRPLGSFFSTIMNALKISHSGIGDYSSSGNYAAFSSASGKIASLPIIT